MRLAHLADIHLGYRQYHRQTPAGINQREADVANAFRRAIDGVIVARPDAVVVAGDLFHAVRPSNQAIVFCFREFQRLRDALPEAKIAVIAGNHDTPRASETGSILKLFAELGIEVATDEAEDLSYPDLDLLVRVVPHQALVSPDRPDLKAPRKAKHEVLVVHGEDPNLWPLDRWWAEPGGAVLDAGELARGGWRYVALGHYHVMRELKPRVWFSGALEYVTPNPWGELIEQRKSGVPGKGWLLVDLEAGTVEPQFILSTRGLHDLKPIEARDLTAAELDRLIQERLAAVPGGLADQMVRLVVHDAPRHLVRELNHAAVRTAKATALHFHLDLRRPEVQRTIGVGAPGPRQTLTDVLRSFLSRRPLPERVDRDRFVSHGVQLLESVTYEPEVQG
jgi:DNA repair exonuclease SbcCD nuclease subunit